MRWKRPVVEAVILSAIAVLFAAASNQFHSPSRRLEWVRKAPDLDGRKVPYGLPSSTVSEITGDVAARLHASGTLFVDARRTDDFAEGHIAGARSVPVWEADADLRISALQVEGVALDREIVAYCSGPGCEDSDILAKKLAGIGFVRVHVYRDGFPDWRKRGLPVTVGTAP